MKGVDELQKEFLEKVQKRLEEFPALAHVGVSIHYSDGSYIENCLKEDGVYDKLKNKWGNEFEKITDFYEDYIIKIISEILGGPIISYHDDDDDFIMEFSKINNEDEEKKLWDIITSLGCNIEYMGTFPATYKFFVRELSDSMIKDEYGLFSIFVEGLSFELPLTNRYIYENI